MKRFFAMHAALLGLISLVALGCSPRETPPEAASSNETSTQSATAAIPAPAASARDACSLITTEEASTIFGSPTTATARSSSAERSTCDYVTQSYQSFTLEAIWSGAEEEIKSARSAAETAARAAGGTQDKVVSDVMGLHRVEGLGDEAYFARRAMSYVRKGDVLLIFQTAGLEEPAQKNWEALARAALSRL